MHAWQNPDLAEFDKMDVPERIGYILSHGVSFSLISTDLGLDGKSCPCFEVEIWSGEGVKWNGRYVNPQEALSRAALFTSRLNVLEENELIVLTFFNVKPTIHDVYQIVRIARKHYAQNAEFASAMMYAIGTKCQHWDSTYVEGTLNDLERRGYIRGEQLTEKGKRYLKELLPKKLHEWQVKYLTKEFDESVLPADQVRTY